MQEGYLAKYAVAEEDKMPEESTENGRSEDPMQGLEGLDVAGPKQE